MRANIGTLPHFLLRAPLALARPLSAQLHVFVKASKQDDFAEVFVSDGSTVGGLKKAVVAELKLDVAPNRVRLLLEVESGAPVPLDSRRKLATQGVQEGSSVVVEVIASEALASAYGHARCISRVRIYSPLSPPYRDALPHNTQSQP